MMILEIESNAREILRIIYHKTNKETFPMTCSVARRERLEHKRSIRNVGRNTRLRVPLHSSRVPEQKIVKAALFVK